MRRAILVIIGLMLATAAFGQLAGTGTNTGPSFNRFDEMGMGVINNFTTSGPAGLVGSLLLVDGASFLLQTDATSQICLAGGC